MDKLLGKVTNQFNFHYQIQSSQLQKKKKSFAKSNPWKQSGGGKEGSSFLKLCEQSL